MKKILRLLVKNYKIIFLIYVLIQFLLIFVYPINFQSDSLRYYKLAEKCISIHTIYPAPINIYDDYIIAPLYINFLILILSIFNSKLVIVFFNIILNLIQLTLVFKLTQEIYNTESAKLASILYILYLSSLGLVFMNLTELFFGCLVLGSIYFYLRGSKQSLVISGLLVGSAIAVRPFGWILLIIYILHFIFNQNRKRNFRTGFSLVGAAIFIISFGILTYLYFGHFIYTSNNGPVNILIGANENANGAYNSTVFENGYAGYIDTTKLKSYTEKENFWKDRAQEYILQHPIKWVSIFPLKLLHIFIWDDFSVHKLANAGDWNLYKVVKTFKTSKSFKTVLNNVPLFNKVLFILLQIYHHIYYYFVFALFLLFIFSKNKELFKHEGINIFLLFIFLGIFVNLLTFGDARFKYSYIIMILIMISAPIFKYINSNLFEIQKNNSQ